jgi:DNA processing protein
MGWQNDVQLREAKAAGIERTLFPEMTDDELKVAKTLDEAGDLQQNQLAAKTNIPISQLTALLFQMEMKGILRPLAGGNYHLLK